MSNTYDTIVNSIDGEITSVELRGPDGDKVHIERLSFGFRIEDNFGGHAEQRTTLAEALAYGIECLEAEVKRMQELKGYFA